MESVLKAQLKQLKTTQKNEPILPNNSEATFLFDFHNSRKIDVDTIYSLGYSGLVELSRYDNSFVKYFQTLLHNTSKYFNRETKKEEDLKPVDILINQLLVELSPYFRHKAAHRVLEFLIKIYNVNIYNAKQLFLAFLPYHESKYFLKLIQNINFDQYNYLAFFAPFVKNGVVILKEALYKELSSNFNLLREVLNFYDNFLTQNNSNVDDSEYFCFLSEVFSLTIKNSNKNIDMNTLNLILQFVNKVFKSFKNKLENINNNEDYEDKIVTGLCDLIFNTFRKVSLSIEYSKAIVNELINKLLVNLKNEETVNKLVNISLFLFEELNNKNVSLLTNETLKNVNEHLELINKSLREADIVTLLVTVLNSTFDGKCDKNLIIEILKTNFNNISDSSLNNFIKYLFDAICMEEKEKCNKEDIVSILSYIDEVYQQQLNSVLIEIFTSSNNQYSKEYISKVKELTRSLNEYYDKVFQSNNSMDNEVNAFNLFINLNSSNISTVLYSIKKFDELCSSNSNDKLIGYSIPSLANKFSFFDKEIILKEILNMSSFKNLLENFREEFIQFFFKLYEEGSKFYSKEFIGKVEENIITLCVNENSEISLKILIYYILIKGEVSVDLLERNSFLFKTIVNNAKNKNISIDESFINYLCTHTNAKLNSVKMFQILYEILNNKNMTTITNTNKIVEYMKKMLNKDIEKINFLKNISLDELNMSINILNIKDMAKNNPVLFESLSAVLIEIIPKIDNVELLNVVRKLANVLIKNNHMTTFDKILKSHFQNREEVFISYLILIDKNHTSSFYEYIQTIINKKIETSLVVALLYSLTINEVDCQIIFRILESMKKFTLVKTNFNLLSNENNNFKVDVKKNEIQLINLVGEITSRKNEIMVNRGYLKKFVTSKCNMEMFSLLNEVFINKSNFSTSEEIEGMKNIFSIFTPNNVQSKKLSTAILKKELINLYKHVMQQETSKSVEYLQLIELLLTGVLLLFSNSTVDVIKLLIESTKLKFSKSFIEFLFSKENFSLEEETLAKDMDFTYKIIKFALSNSINSEVFLTNDSEFGLKVLDFINEKKIVLNEDEQFSLYYLFEIIFKNRNANFNLKYVIKTLYSLELLRTNSESSIGNSVYLNISNNLLTIISNCTVESEERDTLRKCIEEIELNIFSTIKKFKDSNVDTTLSLESVHIVNTLFLCINKLISQFTKIEEEREIVKKLITDCFNILNEEDETYLSSVVRDEVYLIFINAIKNFIELIFESHKQYLNKTEQYEIFYEYIHYFVYFTLTLVNFKFKEGRTIEQTLRNFVNINAIANNEKLLACFFVNLFYYNFANTYEKSNVKSNYYSDIILYFFNREEDPQFTKLGLDILLSIMNQITSHPDKIFLIESTNKSIDSYFLTLNLVNKILSIIDHSFFNLNKIPSVNQTLLDLCLSLNLCRRQITNKMKNNTTNETNNYSFHLKELKTFEDKLYCDLNEAKLLHKTNLLIYDSKPMDKQMRNYLLTKYMEILIVNNQNVDEELSNVFEYFINIVVNKKEDKMDNLQLIFSILTKILNENNTNLKSKIFNFLKSKNNLNEILAILEFSNDSKNNNSLFYKFSVFVFLSKVFCVFRNKFLDKFNDFLARTLNSFDVIMEVKNEELTVLALETFKVLSQKQSEFFSPYLKDIVLKLLLIINTHPNSSEIINLTNSILENIAKAQLLDNTFETAKYSVKYLQEKNLLNQPLSSLMNFLKISFALSDKLMIAGLYNKILKFFIKLLLNTDVKPERVLDCFKAFVLKINEKQLKQIFSDILKFAKEQGDFENDFKYKLDYSIVSFELLNTILNTISIIFVPYFEKYKSYWTDLIVYTSAIFSAEDKRNSSNKKQSRVTYNSAYEDEENRFSYLYLNSLLLENIKLNFKNNTENKILTETIEEILEPLIRQLKFIFFENEEEKLMKYFNSDIRTAFVEIFKNLKTEDLFKDFNDMILNLIREDHFLIKLLTLRMIKSLFEELKDRYVMLLQDIVPYVTDCLEDSNEKVNTEAFKLMKFIEKTTGEDLKNYLDA